MGSGIHAAVPDSTAFTIGEIVTTLITYIMWRRPGGSLNFTILQDWHKPWTIFYDL